jgi:hypothetical protein
MYSGRKDRLIGDVRWLQLILRPRHALWDVPPGMNDQLVIEMAVAAVIDSFFAIWAYVSLLDQSLNDGQVVVQAGRSAKVANMIQKFVHKASMQVSRFHTAPSSWKISKTPSLKTSKRASVGIRPLSWKICTSKGTHYQVRGRRSGFGPLARASPKRGNGLSIVK